MVVHYLYVMILITGLFQSIDFIDGLRCYQCDHPGTVTTNADCPSEECSVDEFYRNLTERFDNAKNSIKKGIVGESHLKLQELCYLQIRRPIPFNGHTRGCYMTLQYKNHSMELDIMDSPIYEDWYVCYTDNCNDWQITRRTKKLLKHHVIEAKDSANLDSLSSYTVLATLLLNYLCFHYYLNT